MNKYKYTVLSDGEVIASNMSVRNAFILEKALFDEYWREPNLSITIVREEFDTVVEESTNG